LQRQKQLIYSSVVLLFQANITRQHLAAFANLDTSHDLQELEMAVREWLRMEERDF
jgi:hypothetical protein